MQTPKLFSQAALYHIGSRLDLAESTKFSKLLSEIAGTLKSVKAKALLFSLKETKAYDLQAVSRLAKEMQYLQESFGIPTGFCDYDDHFFHDALSCSKEFKVGLFKHLNTALLLLGLNPELKKLQTVVYNEDEMLKQMVATELASYGYKVVAPYNYEDFQNYLDNPHEYVMVYETYFDVMERYIPASVNGFVVNYTLNPRVDSKISEHFNLPQHTSRIQQGYRAFAFDAEKVEFIDAKAIDFFCSLALTSKIDDAQIAFFHLNSKLRSSILVDKFKRSGIQIHSSMENLKNDPLIQKSIRFTRKVRGVGVNKILVAKLPLFIEGTIDTFRSLAHRKLTKISQNITTFNLPHPTDWLVCLLRFDGDIDGVMLVAYPKGLAKNIAREIAIKNKEKINNAYEAIMQFTQILGGRIKVKMVEKEGYLQIIDHDAFNGLIDIPHKILERKGIFVELKHEEGSVLLFLTR